MISTLLVTWKLALPVMLVVSLLARFFPRKDIWTIRAEAMKLLQERDEW